ncbi:MAG: chemotaxis protein CheB [Bacteroidia bacterium]
MKITQVATKKKKVIPQKIKVKSFPIVAIGASAGGLEAVSSLLKNLSSDTGMAFIYVQHLNRNHKSMLTSLLARSTKMKVQKIENMELMKPNNIYVIPHNKDIEVTDGHIQLIPRPKNVSSNFSIDVLFSSLAQTHKKNVIGIILSGNASDGTRGLKAIKKAGGLTFAQDDTAKYNSMPASAINEGVVDFILSPEEIAKELTHLSKNGTKTVVAKSKKESQIHDNDPDLNLIFEVLHKGNGVDFSHYKPTTIKRRIQRRILKSKVKTVKEYAKFLAGNPKEAGLLYTDLLINVTSFFRDTETFRYLKTNLLSNLLKGKTKNDTLRIWVPACSTGQEAYSIAMLITEIQEKEKTKIPVQIFATDLSEQTIKDARLGEYSKSELKSISPARIEHFFSKTNGNYRIAQHLREMCVFGTTHNILRDPPFSRMDFISCRNLLIYFDSEAQKKVLATLHFALNEKGYLMLGKSESVGTSSQLFTQLNTKYKIYSRKKNMGIRKVPELTPRFPKAIIQEKNIKLTTQKNKFDSSKLDSVINSILLESFMPACAIINKDMDILQFRGSTSLFLMHPSGKATLNILKMTRPEFSFELRNAIQTVIKTKQAVRKADIELKIDSAFQMMSIEVRPIKYDWSEQLMLVIFTLQQKEIKSNKEKNTKDNSIQKDLRIEKLTEELNNAGVEIHSIIESHETAFEELQAANEEIVSSNEEFQTLNEELESTKEEIEAANEELISTNRELKKHNLLLEESYSYSQTIIATIHEPMLILDGKLNVKSANKSFYKKFHVTQEETEGTPVFDLGNKQWDIPKLHELLEAMLLKNSHFSNFEVTHTFPGMGEKVMLLNASRIIQKTHREKLILLAIKDITERAVRQRKADDKNEEDIRIHLEDKLELENSVRDRTKQLEHKNMELESANKKLAFQYNEKEKRAAELIIANKELIYQNKEKEKRAAELIVANTELAFQNNEKENRAAELIVANTELAFQNNEKENRAAELIVANTELAFQNNEKENRAAELVIANKELIFQNKEKEKRAAELIVANTELAFQNNEKENRAAELIVANKELAFQNNEKENRAAELIVANTELAFQNNEKENRAAELIVANKELAFQNNEKEKRAAELSIANQDLTSFTYISSHDLQEPLRKIQNFATILLTEEKENLSDTGKGYFERMMVTAARMQNLIEDLLTYSRTKGGDVVFELTDLNLLAKEVTKDLEDSIHKKKATVEVNLDTVKVIPFQLRQLIQNLIGNSLKFAKYDVAPVIKIKSKIIKGSKLNNKYLIQKNEYCHITYTDNGIGFDPQYNERIFEVFQRLNSAQAYHGTGIGLAICKRIVENHKGIITATGELGVGARFDIYISAE